MQPLQEALDDIKGYKKAAQKRTNAMLQARTQLIEQKLVNKIRGI
jgi:hypothetical protein